MATRSSIDCRIYGQISDELSSQYTVGYTSRNPKRDGSWRRVTGQATIIYGEIVSGKGGETHFCDMYGAYERLDSAWKTRIAGLRAVHNLDFSRTRRHGEDPMTDDTRHDVAAAFPADG